MNEKPKIEGDIRHSALGTQSQVISPQTIHHPPFIIHHYTTLGSTNDELKQMHDAAEFTCVVADEQTSGRGRRDRTWHSSPGDGLYLSVLLRPLLAPEKLTLLSLLCAVAVAETVAQYSVSADIKWPNDILINERKAGGILIEVTSVGSNAPQIIAGMGVNLNHQNFPPQLRNIATSLALECGRNIDPSVFRDQLLDNLVRWYEQLCQGGDDALLQRWQQLSSYAKGKAVTVTLDEEQITGITAGLTETGALRLRTDNDKMRIIMAGEISHLRTDKP